MKKFLVILYVFTLSLYTVAQTLVKEMDGANTRFIPGNYMKNGEAAIYFSSDEYGYNDGGTSYEAQIFDFELKPLKSFNFQILHPYTKIEQRATNGTKELTRIITQSRNEILGLPSVSDMEARKNAFISWFYDQNKFYDQTLTIEDLTSACRVQDLTIYILLPIKTDYNYYPYPEHLKIFEAYFDASDMFGYNYTYSINVPICNGDWSMTTWYDTPVSNFCTPKCTDVAGMNHWNGGVFLPFSQTFFNDDEKFEYVRYKAEIAEGYGMSDNLYCGDDPLNILFGITNNDRDGDGEEDYRSTYYGVKQSGIEIVSEDGTVIYTFALPETCENNPSIQFFKSDNSILAQVDFNWRDGENNYLHTVRFYRMDKSSGVAKVIREENRISATPNPVSGGLPVRVTIPIGNKGNRIVSLTSLDGVQVYNANIEPNTTTLFIPTENLSSGMYIFTIAENGCLIGNFKILVR